MKLNFKNLDTSNKRVKLTPKTEFTPLGPENNINPSLGIDNNEVTFCLTEPRFSCAGALSNSGMVDLEGEFDVIVDGVVVASGVSAEDLVEVVNGDGDIQIIPFTTTFKLPIYNPIDVSPDVVAPTGLTDLYSLPYFRIEHPNGETKDTGFTLYGQVMRDGAEDHLPVPFKLTAPKDIPINLVNGGGPWIEAFTDLYELSEPLDRAYSLNVDVNLCAYRNVITNRYGWIVLTSNYMGNLDSGKTYFHIDNMGANCTLPVQDGNGPMVATEDNLGNVQNIVIASKPNTQGVQEGTPPPVPPLPPELTPPENESDQIILHQFGYHNLYVNGDLVYVKPSALGYPPSRNDANINSMLNVLRIGYGIDGITSMNTSTGSIDDVILINTREEPIHIKLTRSGWDTLFDVSVSPDSLNNSFVREDADTVHFWLGAKLEETYTPVEYEGIPTNNHFSLKSLDRATAQLTLNDFVIVYLNGVEVYRGNSSSTYPLADTIDADNPLTRTILDYYLCQSETIARVPFFSYGQSPTALNPVTVFENIAELPVEVRFYFPLGVPDYFKVTGHSDSTISERNVVVYLTPRQLIVDVNPSGDPKDCYSINLRREFSRKYPKTLVDDLEVTININRNLTPKLGPNNRSGADYAMAPFCKGPFDTNPDAYSNKVSGIFVGLVPPMFKDGDDFGYESEWNTPSHTGYWGADCIIDLNIYSTVYGLGGTGGFHRNRLTPSAGFNFNGGRGFEPITNYDNVELNIEVHGTGRLIAGGGGGPSQPVGSMVTYTRMRQNLPNGWGAWTPWVEGSAKPVPNSGGGGGYPNGLNGGFRYSSIETSVTPLSSWWKPYVDLGTNQTTYGNPPNFGDPDAIPYMPPSRPMIQNEPTSFFQRAKGAPAGNDWNEGNSTIPPIGPCWHIPEYLTVNAGDYGTYDKWAKGVMTWSLPSNSTLVGGKVGKLINGQYVKVKVHMFGFIKADLTNTPNIIYL